jgi:hypothetical protein
MGLAPDVGRRPDIFPCGNVPQGKKIFIGVNLCYLWTKLCFTFGALPDMSNCVPVITEERGCCV